jgi:hypothetical protein
VEEKVRLIYGNLEEFVKRLRRAKVPEVFFRINNAQLQDGKIVFTAELTAIDADNVKYLQNLIYTESRTSNESITTSQAYQAFKNDFNLRIMGGEVEVQKDGKTEKIPIRGIIPFIQSEYPSCEITNGWVGW